MENTLTADKIKEIACNFEKHAFAFNYFPEIEAGITYLKQEIQGKTIGFGDSETLAKLKLYEILATNNQIVDPMHPPQGLNFKQAGQQALNRDIFISSANALTQDGYLLNMDGSGNRVAGTLFGAEEVYFICGINKLCPNIDAGMERIKNLAAPLNTRRKHLKTPCAKLEPRCYDCQGPDRICNALVIYYHKMRNVKKMEVILIGENLGL